MKSCMHLNPVNRKFFFIALLLLILFISADAQDKFRLYLIGDAGDHRQPGQTLLSLKEELIAHPNSAVVFLGDNSYKDILWGVVPYGYKGFDSSQNTIDKVRSQLSIMDDYKGSVFFVPGNHDWWNRTDLVSGKKKLAMEESFIRQNLKTNHNISNPDNTFLPSKGEYGPAFAEVDKKRIRLVFIDTYRPIQTGFKKEVIPEEEKIFYRRLDSVIRAGFAKGQKVIVLAHNPVYSAGPYTRALKNPYLLKRIKSSMAMFPSYQQMSDSINHILHKYPGIFYASGHVHALQYFYTKDSIHYIISGAGSKDKMLSVKEINRYGGVDSPDQYLLWNSGGFFELTFNEKSTSLMLYYNNGTLKCIVR